MDGEFANRASSAIIGSKGTHPRRRGTDGVSSSVLSEQWNTDGRRGAAHSWSSVASAAPTPDRRHRRGSVVSARPDASSRSRPGAVSPSRVIGGSRNLAGRFLIDPQGLAPGNRLRLRRRSRSRRAHTRNLSEQEYCEREADRTPARVLLLGCMSAELSARDGSLP